MENRSLSSAAWKILCLLLVFDNIGLSVEKIPISFAWRLRNVTSNEEFIRQFVHGKPNSSPLTGREELDANTQADQPIAQFEGCRPRGVPVEIPNDPDPSVFYWPTCVNVSRCGGCCSNEALVCTPTQRKLVGVKVLKMTFNSEEVDPQLTDEVIIQLESHSACDCECRIRASDCNNRTQRYDADSCSCRCINESLSATCRPPKEWNQQQCSCVCTTILNCLDDEYFNYSSCTCQKFPPRNQAEEIELSTPSPVGTTTPCNGCTAAQPTVTPDPCSRYHCRPGLKPTNVSGQCRCLPSTNSSRHRRSAGHGLH